MVKTSSNPKKSSTNFMNYVWYVAYGSNLSRQCFLCYIKGGRPKYANHPNKGCDDTNEPVESKSCQIPYRLYFALPEGSTGTECWGEGGIAFIGSEKETDDGNWSYGRMWKITRHQFEEIKDQEGREWYDEELFLGKDGDGVPVYTVTSKNHLQSCPPSEEYLKTVVAGVRETFPISNPEVTNYFADKEGIKDEFKREDLMGILFSLF